MSSRRIPDNCSGRDVDKFDKFRLTPRPAETVAAPLIEECLANIECRVVDTTLDDKYDLLILEPQAIWINRDRRERRTLHHNGDGTFDVDGRTIDLQFTNESSLSTITRATHFASVCSGQDPRQESARSFVLGVSQHLIGRSGFDDLAVGHEYDAISDLTRKPHLMGDDNHRAARGSKVAHHS